MKDCINVYWKCENLIWLKQIKDFDYTYFYRGVIMDIIEKVKSIINGYYTEQFDKIYLPEDIVKDVFVILASNSTVIEQFCVLHNESFDHIMFQCIVEHSPRICSVRQYLAINNIKQLDLCRDYILKNKDSHFFQGVALLSSINLELMPELVSFTLFDDRFAIILEYDDNGGFYLTKNRDVLIACRKWLSVDIIDKLDLETSFLQEPLMMSADMMSEVSYVLCSHDHMDNESCCWYHSVWQYLRLMNMVSTPSWHHDFYISNLKASLQKIPYPKILISGAADYSSLSYVVRVMELLKKDGHYDVLDLCESPLFACKWYAKRKNIPLCTKKMSIFDLNSCEEYDLICTDAFLTRFPKEQISSILSIWYKALKEYGYVVTTVRIYDDKHQCPETPSNADIATFSNKAYKRSKIWEKVINYSAEEIAKKAGVYASKMKSNKIGTREKSEAKRS